MGKDLYRLLDVPRDADADAIRKAYRRKAFELHPDRNGGSREAEEAFKEVIQAYAVLGDPARRTAYDAGRESGAGTPDFDTADLFGDLFQHPLFGPLFAQMHREFARQGLRFDEAYLRRVACGQKGGVLFGGVVFVWPLGGILQGLFGTALRPQTKAPDPPQVEPRPGLLSRWFGPALPARRPRSTGGDLLYTLPVDADLLRAGGKVRIAIPGPRGPATYDVMIPAGARAGTRLRLPGRGQGSPVARGDLYLEIRPAD
jgi:DnaJ-class molecular chaperone